MHTEHEDETPEGERRDDDNQPGAEGGKSGSTDQLPGAPAEDDAPLGDTDQHSSADA